MNVISRLLLVVLLVLSLSGLLMGSSCQQDAVKTAGVLLTGTETPEQIATKVDAAGLSRVQLWEALKADKHLFSEDEWSWANTLHDKALDLSAKIIVALSSGELPPVAEVEEWLGTGTALNEGAADLLAPVADSLSAESRFAWAVERARLKALGASAQKYIDNPNAAMYARLAKAGLSIGLSAVSGGIL